MADISFIEYIYIDIKRVYDLKITEKVVFIEYGACSNTF